MPTLASGLGRLKRGKLVLLAGILAQTATLILFVWYYKRNSVWKVGFVFLLVTFVFHSVTELLGALSGSVWVSRTSVSRSAVDSWIVVVSLAIFLFCLAHIVTSAIASRKRVRQQTESPWSERSVFLPWRTSVVIGVATLGASMSGDLWDPMELGVSPLYVYFTIGLARDLVWIAPALAGVSVVWALSGRFYSLTLAALLTSTFLIGSRSIVLAAGVLFIYGCKWAGVQVGWKRLVASALATLVVAASVSLLRIGVGREALVQAPGPISRIQLLVEALSPAASTPAKTAPSRTPLDIPEPIGQRVDGNSISAAITERQAQGVSGLGLSSVLLELRLSVPSFLYPTKTATPVEERGAKALIRHHYQLTTPPFPADVLVTQSGAALAYGGVVGLLGGAALLGVGIGMLDLAVLRRRTALPIVIGLGGLLCALAYEQTIYVYATTARSVALLMLIYAVALFVHGRRHHKGDLA